MRVMKVFLPVLFGLVLASSAEAQATVKIGYIDSQGEDLQRLIEQYEQQQAMLSEEAKANREEEIRLKQSQYQQRISELEQQASVRQAELVEPVMERITAVIEEIRAEGAYSMIFDVAAQGIISADPALDLTTEVVRRLQAAHDRANSGAAVQR
jgi:outer membrane protein